MVKARHCCAGCAINDDLVSRNLNACKVVCEGVQICLCLLQAIKVHSAPLACNTSQLPASSQILHIDLKENMRSS